MHYPAQLMKRFVCVVRNSVSHMHILCITYIRETDPKSCYEIEKKEHNRHDFVEFVKKKNQLYVIKSYIYIFTIFSMYISSKNHSIVRYDVEVHHDFVSLHLHGMCD
jgi:hypothetical protein